MKNNVILLLLLLMALCIFNVDISFAKTKYNWPNANQFNYPDHEVNVIKSLKNELELISKSRRLNSYVDINYDFNINKSKYFTLYVLTILSEFIYKIDIELTTNQAIINFVNKHETSSDYSDNGIKNKLLVYTLLQNQHSRNFNSPLVDFKPRKNKLLQNILIHNQSYSALIEYILLFWEGNVIFPDSSEVYVKKEIAKINSYIQKYKGSEFSCQAAVILLRTYP